MNCYFPLVRSPFLCALIFNQVTLKQLRAFCMATRVFAPLLQFLNLTNFVKDHSNLLRSCCQDYLIVLTVRRYRSHVDAGDHCDSCVGPGQVTSTNTPLRANSSSSGVKYGA